MPRILVAGIGNIFFGDDGFGVEVARRLLAEPLADGLEVVDFGIRGVHLAYELAGGGFDGAILVDAVPRGGAPGTLYAIEPESGAEDEAGGDGAGADAHSLTPAVVLAWLRRIGGFRGPIVIIGCEPESLDEPMALSAPVSAAVEGALPMIRALAVKMSMEIAQAATRTVTA